MNLNIDLKGDTPIYKQIVYSIEEAISNNEFQGNKKLPTERELSKVFNVSRGTIKKVFEELERSGKVRKIQGKGTFITGESMVEKREFTIDQIRRLIDNLSSLGLSSVQIRELFIKELWKNLKDEEKLRVAWIDCSGELLKESKKQIEEKCNLKVETFLVEEVVKKPELIRDDFDFLITTIYHYDKINRTLNRRDIEKVIMSVDSDTISKIAKINKDKNTAILYKSENFLELVKEQVSNINSSLKMECVSMSNLGEIDKYDVVITTGECIEALMKRSFNGQIINFKYLLDEGSIIYLEEKGKNKFIHI